MVVYIEHFHTEDGRKFITEASTCGFPPGLFPQYLELREGDGKVHLRRVETNTDEGEVTSVVYEDKLTRRDFTVFND